MNSSLPSASFIKRTCSLFYDTLLSIAVLMVATLIALPLSGAEEFTANNWLYKGFLLIVLAGFFVGFWYKAGHTLGMRAWRLQLVSEDGTPVSLKQCSLRFALAVVSLAFAGLGFIWILFNNKRQTWHDLVAKTRVVQLPKVKR